MLRAGWRLHGFLLASLILSGCAGSSPTSDSTAPAAATEREARTLVALVGAEPPNIAARPLVSAGSDLRFQKRVVNALPAIIDAKGLPQPELLASLPVLNTPSWQVFPDGTMRTTYTLRPNLTWHDGQPLTANDFVFGWQVYSRPDLGQANQAPITFILDVTAVGRDQFTINWKVTYPAADNLSHKDREFPPLPRHLLGAAFDGLATTGREAFVTNPYWTVEYVGLGPYRIQNWESGAHIDLVRFDGYALGTPRIRNIQMRFGFDANIQIASMLSGAAHIGISLDSSEPLKQEWSRTNAGRFVNAITTLNILTFQLRPDYTSPSALLDARVRKALAHLVDKQAIIDMWDGQALRTDTPIWSGSEWGAAIDSTLATYPHDPRAAESLMSQAGFTRGRDGFYEGPGGRLSALELTSPPSADKVQLTAILSDWFKAAGFDAHPRILPAAQARDNEVLSTYPGLLIFSGGTGEQTLSLMDSASIGSAANRWVGRNRSGWSNSEYDRLFAAFDTTLDRGQRVEQLKQMMRIYSSELPFISSAFSLGDDAVVNALKGPAERAPETNPAWNIPEWYFE